MTGRQGLRVLVAVDGSPGARAALAMTIAFPWPAGTRVRSVTAQRSAAMGGRPAAVRAGLEHGSRRVAARARRTLAQRWPDAEAVLVDQDPVPAILGEARRMRADVIVLGWRSRSAFRRLLLGDVVRDVLRQATCAVLVVKRRGRDVRRLVVGVDGSANARRAVAFVAGLARSRGTRVTLVRVLEPIGAPSLGLMPAAVRAALARELAALTAERRARARRELARAAVALRRAGVTPRPLVRTGAPLAELLSVVGASRARLLVVGARGTGGVARLLLGSVAEGALTRCPAPVLIVR